MRFGTLEPARRPAAEPELRPTTSRKSSRGATAVLLTGAFGAMLSLQAADDVVMNAMRDEMTRSMQQLHLENLEKPYFISYRVVERENTGVSASFGALNNSSTGRSRILMVEVRVGDYKFDNSHFFSYSFDAGSSFQTYYGMKQLPLEDDYKELRRELWLATDATYKKAVEDFSKKKASLQNKKREH